MLLEKDTVLKVFTAFSGYDSQCLALKRLSQVYPEFKYELVGWSEIDKAAIMAHDALFPEAKDKNLGDISKIDWSEVPDFDLFTYSSPCQDFSLAGKLSGGEEGSGTRSSLLWECQRCIEEKRPKYLLLENVTNLVSKRFFPLFEKWMKTVESYGYVNFWSTLNAKNYGVPQNRDRVFLVSIRKDSKDEDIDYEFPNPLEKDSKLSDILEPEPIDKIYFIHQSKVNEWIRDNEQRIMDYVAERNGLDPESLVIEQEQEDNINTDDNMDNNEQELNNMDLCPCDSGSTECSCSVTEQTENEENRTSESDEKKERPETVIHKVSKKKKTKTRGGHLVRQIPTPTTSQGAVPTLMATGYGSADYKNFYSVGHFPKLGILEIWSDDTDEVVDYTGGNNKGKLF